LIHSHSFGEQFSQKKWTKEIAGQREILSAYGGVRLEDVRGMRAPFLAVSYFIETLMRVCKSLNVLVNRGRQVFFVSFIIHVNFFATGWRQQNVQDVV
jgi:hypothetical protein